MKQNADAVQCNTTKKTPNASLSHGSLFTVPDAIHRARMTSFECESKAFVSEFEDSDRLIEDGN